MKLKTVKIKNFRGYKGEKEILFDDLTTFIGKNDAGKSTILEALEIFFNNELVKAEKEDLCVLSTGNEFEISCEFSELPSEVILDSQYPTNLKEEYLLNKNGCLEIVKKYKCTSNKPKETVYINAVHPKNTDYSNLLDLSIKQLRDKAKAMEVPESEYSGSISSTLRKAIWNNADNLDLEERLLEMNKNDGKKIFEQIVKYLPMYSLFQSDRTSDDSDREVTEPMKAAINLALNNVDEEIKKIKATVQSQALDTAKRTLEKLSEMDPYLARELVPEFKTEPNFNSLFKLTINSDDNIPVNKRGSGVRRLILLNFFRAEAEKRLQEKTTNSVIYAFEEPETSQHPDNQQMLMKSFIDLSQADNTQVILTTHTPNLGGMVPIKSLRFITKDSERNVIILNEANTEMKNEIIETLGIYPTNIERDCKGILFVEGVTDIEFLKHINKELETAGYLTTNFEKENLMLLPMGGCDSLSFWVQSDLAKKHNLPCYVFMDSDKGTPEEKKQLEIKNEYSKQDIPVFLTRKREIENYIDPSVLDVSVSFTEVEDAKEVIASQNRVRKNKIISTYWPKMTADLIRNVEKYKDDSGNYRFEFTEILEEIFRNSQ